MRKTAMVFLLFCHGLVADELNFRPLSPFDSGGCLNVVFNKLTVENSSAAFMLSLPSFGPERAVIFSSVEIYKENNGQIVYPVTVLNSEYFLKVAEASSEIMKECLLNGSVGIESNVRVKSIGIDKKSAEMIIDAWRLSLLKTQYADGLNEVLDGTSYIFYLSDRRNGEYYGAAVEPEYGLAKEMVELGLALGELVDLPMSERVMRMRQIEIKAQGIIKKKME